MTVKSGQAWSGLFNALDNEHYLYAATGTPVGVLYVNGVANVAVVTVTGANPYKFAVTLPALTAGDTVSMYATATIDGVTTGGVVAEEIADTSRVSDVAATIGVAGAGLTAIGDARMANLNATVGSRAIAGDLMGLANDAITSAKFDESTAFPLKAADTGATILARTGGAMALTAGAVDAILDEVVEGTLTMRQMLRLFAAFMLNKASGGGTATITFQDLGDTKPRITMTVNNTTGDRTNVVLDGS
jgi:hypothetical protein